MEKYLVSTNSFSIMTKDIIREKKSGLYKKLVLQVKFNMANDRHLTRLNERAEDAGSVLLRLNDALLAAMTDSYVEVPSKHLYYNLEMNFEAFINSNRSAQFVIRWKSYTSLGDQGSPKDGNFYTM